MIESQAIEIVYSKIDGDVIHSEFIEDYRELDEQLRLLEDGEIRIIGDDNKRLLE